MEMKEAFGNAGVLKTKKTQAKQVSPAPNDVHVRIPTIRSIKETTAVAEKRQYIGDIGPHMAGLVVRIRGIQTASPEERAIRSQELKALEDEVFVHLNADNELLRNAAKKAYDIAMISASADISVNGLFAKKPGKVFLNVPDMDNGKEFLRGGVLLAESDGKVVRAFKTSINSGFQKIMEEVIESKVFVPIWAISSGHFNKPANMSDEKFRLAWILHAVLRRGLAAEFARQKSVAPAAPAKIINP